MKQSAIDRMNAISEQGLCAMANCSSGMARKNESGPIWLAWAAIAARFLPMTADTSMAWVISASGMPNDSDSARSRRSSSIPSSPQEPSSARAASMEARLASRFLLTAPHGVP